MTVTATSPLPPSTSLFPVVLSVPRELHSQKGPSKNLALSELAREALFISAKLLGVNLGSLEKTEYGAPIPSQGFYWSLSHTDEFVAAVCAREPVGIDIEKIRPFSPALPAYIAGPEEWEHIPVRNQLALYRYWTAKEAVLKAETVGLKGLADCKITAIVSERETVVQFKSRSWSVSHLYAVADHLASVTFLKKQN